MIEIKDQAPSIPIRQNENLLSGQEQRRLKLQKSTQAFESIFIAQLLKNMRSVSFAEEQEEGFGKEIMLSMADESVAQQLSKTNMLGIGKMLYQHLLKRLEAESIDPQQLKIGKSDHTQASNEITPIASPPRKLKVSSANLVSEAPKPATAASVSATVARKQQQAIPSETAVADRAHHTETKSALEQYMEHIRAAASENQLPENLLKAMIMRESGGNAQAVSPKGAAGLMQLMPDTARAMGVTDPLDPEESIHGGAKYLRSLLDRFGSLKNALAAYNAGPSNVTKYGGVPPFAETEKYVEQVLADVSKTR
jgi:Rod binding domain-containing protein